MQNFEEFHFTCQDGYSLSARFYPHQNSTLHPILIAPATGIKKSFYHHFATWLNQQGHAVMVFDFRGIGASLHGSLTQSQASIVDWGTLDLPAALETLLVKTQRKKAILIGHSAGGQLTGLMANHEKLLRIITISGSTGHIKGLKGKTRLLAPVMFKILFPASCFFKGYGATQCIGMGENLPRRVAQQWAEFCSRPGYAINAIGKYTQVDYHAEVKAPIIAFWPTDDEIATHDNIQDLLGLYPKAHSEIIKLEPSIYQHLSIGHMGFFKQSHQNLWSIALKEIQK